MTPAALAMPGNEALADALAAALALERVAATVRRFPDGESHVRVEGPLNSRDALIACSLDRPDDKLVPLMLLACAAREAGARSVGLVAPYLAYMRQDACFQPGETISARHVAAWLSQPFDWLVTVDPHLHRIHHLDEVYRVPSRVVPAAPAVAAWLRERVARPLLVGPDEESAQWAADVALCRRHLAEYGAQPPTSGRIVATRRSGETVIVTVAHGRRHTDLQVVRDEELLRVIDPVHWSGVRVVSPPGPAATVSP